LLDTYALPPATPSIPAVDDTLTIEPPPASFSAASADFMPSQQPTWFTSISLR
jgi:hypothetical protein